MRALDGIQDRKEKRMERGMQEKRDSGLKGFRTRGIHKRRDLGLEGYRKRGFRIGGMRNRKGGIQ